jgi:nucleoside 2-deoxyribosyltransferase
MTTIYLACPYSHSNPAIQKSRFETVSEVATKLQLRGHIVFSPISHSAPMEKYLPSEFNTHDHWLNQDKWFLDRADELYVLCLPGWADSYGVEWEIRYMRERKKPVTLIDENLKELFPN